MHAPLKMLICRRKVLSPLYAPDVVTSSLKKVREFGGDLINGKRKSARPIATKRPMHTTLRSEWAKGPHSLLMAGNVAFIRARLKALSAQFGICIYEYSINSNHLHLLTRAKSREGYKSFLRALSGVIAMKITGAKKGARLVEKFWLGRPWSRIIDWGRAFFIAKKYVIRNHPESIGIISYTPRLLKRARAGPTQWLG